MDLGGFISLCNHHRYLLLDIILQVFQHWFKNPVQREQKGGTDMKKYWVAPTLTQRDLFWGSGIFLSVSLLLEEVLRTSIDWVGWPQTRFLPLPTPPTPCLLKLGMFWVTPSHKAAEQTLIKKLCLELGIPRWLLNPKPQQVFQVKWNSPEDFGFSTLLLVLLGRRWHQGSHLPRATH